MCCKSHLDLHGRSTLRKSTLRICMLSQMKFCKCHWLHVQKARAKEKGKEKENMMLRIPHKFSASAWKIIDMCITTFCIRVMRQKLKSINVLQVVRRDAHRIDITPSFFRQMRFCRLRYNREFTAHLCMILFHGRILFVLFVVFVVSCLFVLFAPP